MMLCDTCSALRDVDWGGPNDFLLNHHQSYANLRDSAQTGCLLCILLRIGINHLRGENDRSGVAKSSALPEEVRMQQIEKPLLENPKPFYLERVYSTVNGTGGIHGFHYEEGSFDFNPSRVRIKEVAPAFLVKTRHDLTASKFLRRLQGPGPDLHLAASWLGLCQSEHLECRGQVDPIPPTRLLRIFRRGSDLLVALVNPSQERGPYIALSHCWGLVTPLRTTTTNYSDHAHGIKVSSLPKTFRDAVTLAQHFSVKYLWIDSLCIIQDSTQDWERECPQMSNIYSNSVLTIAAHDAPNSSVGFLADYPHDLFPSVEVPIKANDGTQSTAVVEYSPKGFFESSKWQSFLSNRGWVLQERVLSPRLLSSHRNRLIWECNRHVRSDDRHRPVQIEPGRAGAIEKHQIDMLDRVSLLDYWDHIVTVYSECQLTRAEDRLPALSGIAQKTSVKLNDRYVAGLWEADLHYGLAWHNQRHTWRSIAPCCATQREEPPPFTAPSWSWASTECKVSFSEAYYKLKELSLISVSIEPRGQDPFGQIRRGVIRAHGQLSKILIARNKHFCSSEDESQVVGQFYPDCHQAYKFSTSQQTENQQKEVFALLLSVGGVNDCRQPVSWTGLALEKEIFSESFEDETYRRIGLLRCLLNDWHNDSDLESDGDEISDSPQGSYSDQGSGSDQVSNSSQDSDRSWEIPPNPEFFSNCERRTVVLV